MRSIGRILQILDSIGLLAYLISGVDFEILAAKAGAISWVPATATIFMAHLDRSLMAYKWRELIRSSGLRISFKDALITTYMGNFAGTFLPAGVGGDVVRVHLLRRMRLPGAPVVASIAVERMLGLLAFPVVSLLSLWLAELGGISMPSRVKAMVMAVFFSAMGAAALSCTGVFSGIRRLLSRQGNQIIQKVGRVLDSFLEFSQRKRVLVAYFMLSLAEVALVNVIFVFSSASLHLDLNPAQLFVVVPIILLLQRIPVSLNGVGLHEGLLALFFVMLGERVEHAIAFSVFLRALEVVVILPGGVLFFQKQKLRAC